MGVGISLLSTFAYRWRSYFCWLNYCSCNSNHVILVLPVLSISNGPPWGTSGCPSCLGIAPDRGYGWSLQCSWWEWSKELDLGSSLFWGVGSYPTAASLVAARPARDMRVKQKVSCSPTANRLFSKAGWPRLAPGPILHREERLCHVNRIRSMVEKVHMYILRFWLLFRAYLRKWTDWGTSLLFLIHFFPRPGKHSAICALGRRGCSWRCAVYFCLQLTVR